MKRWLLLLPLLTLCIPAFATTRYIAQTAGTFSGGIACNGHTAITPATFNSTTLSPGDINYVCGTITVAAHTTALTVSQSGTSGNPITILFDSGAILTSPEWPADGTSGAIDIGGSSYITINGNGGTGGYTQGIIEATLNGDAGATCLGGPCSLHGDSNAIETSGNVTGLTVEGLSIVDMYVAIDPEGGSTNPGGGSCIYSNGNLSGWVITNNYMHDMGWCLSLGFNAGSSSNLTISHNTIFNVDHGLALGGNASGANFTTISIHDNNIHDYSNWDTTSDYWHHDGIHIWGNNDDAEDTINGVYVYNNTFGGCIGTNVTAHIFIEQNGGGTENVAIFNNTLIDTCDGVDNDGMLTTGVDGNHKIYNNAILCTSSGNNDKGMGTSSSPNITFVNNVVSGCNQDLMYMASGSALSGGLHNNLYANGSGNCSSGGNNCFQYGSNGGQGLFSVWQSQTGQDASPSQYATSAGLNSSGVPQSGSAAIGNGANLTSLCSGALAPLCSDLNGSSRPSSGAWTIGAINYGSVPAAPTNLIGIAVGVVQ